MSIRCMLHTFVFLLFTAHAFEHLCSMIGAYRSPTCLHVIMFCAISGLVCCTFLCACLISDGARKPPNTAVVLVTTVLTRNMLSYMLRCVCVCLGRLSTVHVFAR